MPSPAVPPAPPPPVVPEPLASAPKAAEPLASAPKAAEPLASAPKADEPLATAPKADERLANAAKADERLATANTAGWKDGFFIQTAGGDAKLKIGGFTQFDGRLFLADADDPHTDQFGFRSIRPDLQGTVFEHYDFRLFPDFAGGRLVVQDAYVDVHYSEVVRVRAGKFKVPFGLERLQGEAQTMFVERGLPSQLVPNRDLGVQLSGDIGALSYQVGVFNGVADGGSGDGDISDDKEGAVRVFVRPFADGPALVKDLGVGVAATYGDTHGTPAATDLGSFRTQGQTTFFAYRVGPTLMDTDTVIADGRHGRWTAQGYWYTGPFGVLAEYVRSTQHVALAGTHAKPTVEAWQAAAQWVLTGEAATYKSVTPQHAYGAFDVAARIAELRFRDTAIFDEGFADPTKSSRRAWSAGAGADWFANKAFRVVLDLERTWYTLGSKTGDRAAETSLTARAQLAF